MTIGCLKCGVWMRPEEIGVTVLETINNGQPYQTFQTDRLTCPGCGFSIVATTANPAHADAAPVESHVVISGDLVTGNNSSGIGMKKPIDPNVMTKKQYEEKYAHSRNVPVSLRTDEAFDGLPFILTVGYISNQSTGNGIRAVELDRDIMPFIRRAVKRYIRQRKAEWKDQRHS